VLQKIGTMAYKLELPTYSRVHPFFHVSCLKKIIGDNIPVQTILPELYEEGKIILEPQAITDTRISQLRNRSISEYLIKWRKLLIGDSTWEDESFIQKPYDDNSSSFGIFVVETRNQTSRPILQWGGRGQN
jgi:hypothetical protein